MLAPAVAAARACKLLADPSNATAVYGLGDGDSYADSAEDLPWTRSGAIQACDCMGLVAWAFWLRRHRPGYNAGAWATVSDDVNPNSMIEDADHARELFVRVVDAPQVGDVICYPTIHLDGKTFIGHIGIVVGVARWDGASFASLDTVQVCGPNGRSPAAIATTGIAFDHHSATWPKPEHRSVLLRAVV